MRLQRRETAPKSKKAVSLAGGCPAAEPQREGSFPRGKGEVIRVSQVSGLQAFGTQDLIILLKIAEGPKYFHLGDSNQYLS